MFDFHHRIVGGRLLAYWEPGLFAFPGVLFLWACLIVMHRVALRGFEGNAGLVYGCAAILFVAGLCLACGRAGYVFAPARNQWAFGIGLFTPFVRLRRRPLESVEAVRLERELGPGGEPSHELHLAGPNDRTAGGTDVEPVAFSVAESLATFLRKPLELKDPDTARPFPQPPHFGVLQACSSGAGADKSRMKSDGGEVAMPHHAFALRGRGPLLLGIFMAVVLLLSWRDEELGRTAWGIAAAVFVAIFCLWAFVYGANALARRTRLRAEKAAISVVERGLWRRAAAYAWPELRYLAVLPSKKGFLQLAGRDSCIVVGDARSSRRIGESLSGEDLISLYRLLLQQYRRFAR